MPYLLLFWLAFGLTACNTTPPAPLPALKTGALQANDSLLLPPPNCKRILMPKGSFGRFLQDFPRKQDQPALHFWDGSLVADQSHHIAILDLPLHKNDLVQCADALISLRARYLRQQGLSENICFNLTNGMSVPYQRWINGDRVQVNNNDTKWINGSAAGDTPENFEQYLTFIFTYAGSYSLSQELPKVPADSIVPGHLFLQGGTPGHTMIISDLAIDTVSGKKYFMLAQGFMPSLEVHIVSNPEAPVFTPWYEWKATENLITPNWIFHWEDLYRFR